MFEVMQQHGGVISDIAGDGVMCVWCAPAHTPSACTGAVGAAVGLLEAVEKFNLAHPNHLLPTRIGIHAGSALLGIVGGAGRYASTVVGDVANTASRIEGLNKQLGTRLLASEEALNQVQGFILRPLDGFLLAGKSEPIRVSEVLGRVGNPRAGALAGSFAEAFESFQSRCWGEAAMMFEALLRVYRMTDHRAIFWIGHYCSAPHPSKPPLRRSSVSVRIKGDRRGRVDGVAKTRSISPTASSVP
jgi:adenylate cyclase